MRRLYRAAVLTLVALVLFAGAGVFLRPGTASAHPLGNFTINQYSRIELESDQVSLRYVLDMAEIPAFQETPRIDADEDGQISAEESDIYKGVKAEEIRQGLHLSIDNSPVRLDVVESDLSFPPGQGGLNTLRFSLLLKGELEQAGQESRQLQYSNDNYGKRLGWNEIVVKPGNGIGLINSTASEHDRSNELRDYPGDVLENPPELREVRSTFRFVSGSAGTLRPEQETPSESEEPGPKGGDALTSLITADKLSLPVIVLSLIFAIGLGALHAMSPGHGKTIMAAYLIGTRGTARHALFLGFTVTVSHTLGVLALGLVTLYASHLIAPEQLYAWLGLFSGLVIAAIGVWLLLARLRRRHRMAHDHHGHPDHAHDDHKHNTIGLSWKNLAALGVANGFIPSVSALLILLAAISLHRIAFGLLLVLAFSTGMALVLGGVGLLLVYGGRIVSRTRIQNGLVGRAVRLMPIATALVVLVSGLVVTARALLQVS